MKICFTGAHEGSNTKALFDYYTSLGHNCDLVNNGSVYDLAFTNNGRLIEGVRAKLKVNSGHGNLFLGDTQPEPQYQIRLALAASESEKAMMVRNGYNPDDVLVTGQPRMDLLRSALPNARYVKEASCSNLGWDPVAPIVMYAPTYSRSAFGVGDKLFFANSTSAERDVETAEAILKSCRKYGANLLIRLHKYIKRKHGGRLVPSYLNHLLDQPEVYVVDNEMCPNSIPWLLSSDLLITDFSSIAADFMALRKPIVFLDPHAGWEYTTKWHASRNDRNGIGTIAYGPGGASVCLESWWENRYAYPYPIDEMVEKYQPNFDGRCCERVYEGVEEAWTRIFG